MDHASSINVSHRSRGKALAGGSSKAEQGLNAQFSTFCYALGHPVRVRILKLLVQEHCVFGDLARKIPLAQSTISQHLKLLKRSGLVYSECVGQNTCYCISTKELKRFKKLIDVL